MGIVLNYEDITEESVVDAIRFALKSHTRINAQKVAYSFKNRPISSTDLAVYWAEHTIATKGAPLSKPYSVFVPAVVYYNLDIFATIIAIMFAVIYSWIWIVNRILHSETKKVKKH